jgi:hypothetical protein
MHALAMLFVIALAIRISVAVVAMVFESYYHMKCVEYGKAARVLARRIEVQTALAFAWNKKARQERRWSARNIIIRERMGRLARLSFSQYLMRDMEVYKARAIERNENAVGCIERALMLEEDVNTMRENARENRRALRIANENANTNAKLRRVATVFARV